MICTNPFKGSEKDHLILNSLSQITVSRVKWIQIKANFSPGLQEQIKICCQLLTKLSVSPAHSFCPLKFNHKVALFKANHPATFPTPNFLFSPKQSFFLQISEWIYAGLEPEWGYICITFSARFFINLIMTIYMLIAGTPSPRLGDFMHIW